MSPGDHRSKLVTLANNVLCMEHRMLELRGRVGRAVVPPAFDKSAARPMSIHLENPGK